MLTLFILCFGSTVSLVSSACGAGGEQPPPVIGRKGETESEREKQLQANCIRAAKGRALCWVQGSRGP